MAPSPEPIPLRFPKHDEAFAELCAALVQTGYLEAAICQRLGIERISQFALDQTQRPARQHSADTLDLMIQLFLEGASIPRSVTSALPLQLLLDFGLVTSSPQNSDLFAATVMLAPMRGLYTVADRQRPMHEQTTQLFTDIVYPAIVPNTDLFLELARPEAQNSCDSFLDLCAGTGIAAMLAAANGARQAYAYDVTERSTVFADFNRRLNGLLNVTAARGDLYEPAGELTFDRIVAHPPYVPVFRPQFIFDSGGQDGEQIVRRIIEGLPRYLRPGGVFHSLTMGTDRAQPFEQRVREWLGKDQGEFDVAMVVRKTLQPHEWAADNVIRNRGPVTDISEWRAFFREIGAKAMPYGFLTIQRRARIRPVFTVRRQTGARTGFAEHAWLMQWETQIVEHGPDALLAARPLAASKLQMTVEHHLQSDEPVQSDDPRLQSDDPGNADWIPDTYLLLTEYPFRMELRAQPFIAHLLTCANGIFTGAELLEKLKADGALHPDAPAEEFAEMLAVLVSGGFLKL